MLKVASLPNISSTLSPLEIDGLLQDANERLKKVELMVKDNSLQMLRKVLGLRAEIHRLIGSPHWPLFFLGTHVEIMERATKSSYFPRSKPTEMIQMSNFAI